MLSNISTKISNSLSRYSVAKTRHLLLGLDDDQLEQVSISRELLQRGVDYWPWQIEDDGNSRQRLLTDSTTSAGESLVSNYR